MTVNPMRRRFNRGERIELYLAQHGKCIHCGGDLDSRWEADHMIPFVAGGPTVISNGGASCRRCNRRKGDRVMPLQGLRPWQQDCYQDYFAKLQRDYLASATPGGGKTKLANRIMSDMVGSHVARVVVVVPTAHLKRQWADAASKEGLHLLPDYDISKGREPRDCHGLVVTYQSLSVPNNYRMHRRLARESDTLFTFDEIHHAAEVRAFGEGCVNGSFHARYRLLLTGTPFRSDNNEIPFIRYDQQGFSDPDFTFSYRQAVQQGVCRPIFFPARDAKVEWWRGGERYEADFAETLGPGEESIRLRSSVNVHFEAFQNLLKEAHQELLIVRREEQPDAGGLVVAMDQKSAREIVEYLHQLTGERPVLAISDMPDDLKPSEEIARFARGKQLWLVAVQMVSEGVDIPRLAVGVYGTNIVSRMFFKQFVGRFVRMRDGFSDQQARLYIPADGRLIQHAVEIKEERDLALREDANSSHRSGSATTTDQLSTYQQGDARSGPKTVVWEGGLVVSDELLRGTQELEKIGIRDPSERIVTIAALLTRSSQKETELAASPTMPAQEPHYQTRIRKRREAARLGRILAIMREQKLGGKDHFKKVFQQLQEIQGVSQETATIPDFDERIALLNKWLAEEEEMGNGQ